VTDRGLFYRPIHSAKAALPKRRRRRRSAEMVFDQFLHKKIANSAETFD
jgi:hypothetical protein